MYFSFSRIYKRGQFFPLRVECGAEISVDDVPTKHVPPILCSPDFYFSRACLIKTQYHAPPYPTRRRTTANTTTSLMRKQVALKKDSASFHRVYFHKQLARDILRNMFRG